MRFVVILATGFFSFDCNFNWLQFVTDSFFYLCANQTRHASDSSALCRVFSTRCFRFVIHTDGNGFLFIYFHICTFRDIYIEKAM